MNLLVVGSLAFDSVETPFGQGEELLGGAASFLSTAASYYCPVQMVGVVGDDFPSSYVEFFKSRGIDTSGLQYQAGKTFRWRGRYGSDLNVAQTLDTQLNVFKTFRPDLPENFKDTPYVVLGNIDPELQLHVLKQVRNPKLIACDTMNYWIDKKPKELKQTLKHVHLLSISDGEARLLSGEPSLLVAARLILKMGPKILIIKRGEYGALLFTEDQLFVIPGYPLETVKDPTGAGDTFAGGMMGYLAQHDRFDAPTLRKAVVLGSILASFAVEEFSLERLRHLAGKEIKERFMQFKALTHFDAELANPL
jgi:sugar/nucleoside kinase (ribokinase family)